MIVETRDYMSETQDLPEANSSVAEPATPSDNQDSVPVHIKALRRELEEKEKNIQFWQELQARPDTTSREREGYQKQIERNKIEHRDKYKEIIQSQTTQTPIIVGPDGVATNGIATVEASPNHIITKQDAQDKLDMLREGISNLMAVQQGLQPDDPSFEDREREIERLIKEHDDIEDTLDNYPGAAGFSVPLAKEPIEATVNSVSGNGRQALPTEAPTFSEPLLTAETDGLTRSAEPEQRTKTLNSDGHVVVEDPVTESDDVSSLTAPSVEPEHEDEVPPHIIEPQVQAIDQAQAEDTVRPSVVDEDSQLAGRIDAMRAQIATLRSEMIDLPEGDPRRHQIRQEIGELQQRLDNERADLREPESRPAEKRGGSLSRLREKLNFRRNQAAEQVVAENQAVADQLFAQATGETITPEQQSLLRRRLALKIRGITVFDNNLPEFFVGTAGGGVIKFASKNYILIAGLHTPALAAALGVGAAWGLGSGAVREFNRQGQERADIGQRENLKAKLKNTDYKKLGKAAARGAVWGLLGGAAGAAIADIVKELGIVDAVRHFAKNNITPVKDFLTLKPPLPPMEVGRLTPPPVGLAEQAAQAASLPGASQPGVGPHFPGGSHEGPQYVSTNDIPQPSYGHDSVGAIHGSPEAQAGKPTNLVDYIDRVHQFVEQNQSNHNLIEDHIVNPGETAGQHIVDMGGHVTWDGSDANLFLAYAAANPDKFFDLQTGQVLTPDLLHDIARQLQDPDPVKRLQAARRLYRFMGGIRAGSHLNRLSRVAIQQISALKA